MTWFQCVVCLICLFFLSFFGENYPRIGKFPAFSIDLKVARQVGSISCPINVGKEIGDGFQLSLFSLLKCNRHKTVFGNINKQR